MIKSYTSLEAGTSREEEEDPMHISKVELYVEEDKHGNVLTGSSTMEKQPIHCLNVSSRESLSGETSEGQAIGMY